VGSNIWLSIWSESRMGENGTEALDTGERDMFLGVYGALGVGQGDTSLLIPINSMK
jgi:ATP-binding cassette subfamily C (CFTR/MRP) protein 1